MEIQILVQVIAVIIVVIDHVLIVDQVIIVNNILHLKPTKESVIRTTMVVYAKIIFLLVHLLRRLLLTRAQLMLVVLGVHLVVAIGDI